VGRFATPTLVIDGEVLLGFGMNLARVRQLLDRGGYLRPNATQADPSANQGGTESET